MLAVLCHASFAAAQRAPQVYLFNQTAFSTSYMHYAEQRFANMQGALTVAGLDVRATVDWTSTNGWQWSTGTMVIPPTVYRYDLGSWLQQQRSALSQA